MNTLLKKCYAWWNSLTEYKQFWLMMEWYPYEVKEDTNADKFFGDMPQETQLWIYERR
jgi:hypothetical protein